MCITYLDGPRLRRSLLAACEYARAQRAELNRINVFPVPDGDTGTNLSLTVQAISDHLRRNEDRAVEAVARAAAEAAVLGARGNAGMMLSHFLVGFSDRVRGRERIGTAEFGEALHSGVTALAGAIERPVEGTILTVMRDTAVAAAEARAQDFIELVEFLLERARLSLERTPELLPTLRKAGVVDAGAKGFVHLLEGVHRLIRGEPVRREAAGSGADASAPAAGTAEYPEGSERYRFCTEALVRGGGLPSRVAVQERLSAAGDSVIVLRTGDLLKVHVHTDDPEGVFAYLRTLGDLVTHKAEDMEAQHAVAKQAAAAHLTLARRPVGIVADSAADLPEEVVRAHGIKIVPLILVDGERVLRDKVDVTAEEFHARMRRGGDLPTTSQPPPAAFLDAYREAAEEAEAVVGVMLSSGLSGTFQAAEAAAYRFEGGPVHLVDSLGASILQGLLVLKAAELAELALPPERIAEMLREVRRRSGVYLTVDRLDRLRASGRISKGQARLAAFLRLKPILTVSMEGKVQSVTRVVGRRRVLPAVLRLLREAIPPGTERLRFGTAHVGCPEVVEEVEEALRREWGEVEIVSVPATPVLATHLGLGAWAVAYMVEA